MDVIILGGLSKKSNQQWVEELTTELQSAFPEARYHLLRYNHWATKDEDFDRAVETQKLEDEATKTKGDYVVVAKSVGSIITIDSVVSGRISPRFCLLMGLPLWYPLDDKRNDRYRQMVAGYNLDTRIIQNPDERYMNPEQLQQALPVLNIRNTTVVQGYDGNGHNYAVNCVKDNLLPKLAELVR